MRFGTWMLCLVLAAGLVACSSDSDDANPTNGPDSEAPPFVPTPEQPATIPVNDGEVPPEPEETVAVTTPQGKLLVKLAEPETRDEAVEVIREKGSAAVPDLVAALDDPNWRVRAGAAFGLSILGKEAEQALPQLRKMAESEQHESVRDAAAWAIDAISESE